jgi:hypothetical protein
MTSEFEKELRQLLNRHCRENGSNTPDLILADYLKACLDNLDIAIIGREGWYGRRETLLKEGLPPTCPACGVHCIHTGLEPGKEE